VKKKIKLKLKGKNTFHPIYINWSKRNLGKFALIKIKIKVVKITFRDKEKVYSKLLLNIPSPLEYWVLYISTDPPPKKKITNRLDISKMLEYSPKKKPAKAIPEYSTL
jgi:hypothetical protein